MKIVCVYATGGDFDAEYVEKLYDSINYYTHIPFVCITDSDDVPRHIPQEPLEYGFGGWWSKMEMFKKRDTDILYFDLDTIITGSIDLMIEHCRGIRPFMLSDFYRPERLASGIMYIPVNIQELIFKDFCHHPYGIMNIFRGDQDYIEDLFRYYKVDVCRWDEWLGKDYICSYKAHVLKQYPNSMKPLDIDVTKSVIVCYHGKPRPKDTGWKVYEK